MLNYPARIEPDGEGFLVTFRDIPEALTGGATTEEALNMASDALITAMDFYFDDKRTIPLPSKVQDGEVLIELPSSLAIKVMLLNEILAQRLRPIDLANRMHIKRSEANRLLKLDHTTKIDNLSSAFKALGKNLEFRVQ
jgi:antitoxin HicB